MYIQYREVKFEWDENKNRINIKKHGVDFADVVEIFDHPMLTALDERADYGEDRWIGLGAMKAIAVVVVYIEKRENIVRIVSARKATKHEEKKYHQALFGH